MGKFGISGRRFFRKGASIATHHTHVFQSESLDIERHLAFRDYLRENRDIAEKYGNLKEDLARRFPDNIKAYMDGKNDFIKKIEKKQSNGTGTDLIQAMVI